MPVKVAESVQKEVHYFLQNVAWLVWAVCGTKSFHKNQKEEIRGVRYHVISSSNEFIEGGTFGVITDQSLYTKGLRDAQEAAHRLLSHRKHLASLATPVPGEIAAAVRFKGYIAALGGLEPFLAEAILVTMAQIGQFLKPRDRLHIAAYAHRPNNHVEAMTELREKIRSKLHGSAEPDFLILRDFTSELETKNAPYWDH